MSPCRGNFEPTWAQLGATSGQLGLTYDQLRHPGSQIGPVKHRSDEGFHENLLCAAKSGPRGHKRGPGGTQSGPREASSGPRWANLGQLGATLAPTWVQLRPACADLGPPWGHGWVGACHCSYTCPHHFTVVPLWDPCGDDGVAMCGPFGDLLRGRLGCHVWATWGPMSGATVGP